MKIKERPITQDNSIWRDALRKAMSDTKVDNPYESERHVLAREYLDRRKIKVPKLRHCND